MEPILLSEAAEAMRARPIGDISGDADRISTDTRAGVARSLFFALRGENFDGHTFVRQAFERGAAAAVVERFVENGGLPQLIVRDSTMALGHLARWWRNRFDIPVVGITGSVGKTSTKEIVAHTLRGRFQVLVSEKNFNNEIGVPQTLFQLSNQHQAVVLEMGMRGAGQIAHLADAAGPTVGVITNIGLSHIELLGSRQAIAEAKAELLESLPESGTAVINADDLFAGFLTSKTRANVLTFGTAKGADFRSTHVRFNDFGEPAFRVNGTPVRIYAAGTHHVINSAAACAVAYTMGMEISEAAAQLESFRPPAMRMETIQLENGTTVLNDSYNAAPDSMRSALETLGIMARNQRRKVAILGDMKELGQETEAGHGYVGEQAAAQNLALLITVGKLADTIADSASALGKRRIQRFPNTDSAIRQVHSLLEPGDLILVKGSRAMGMERIVEAIVKGES